MSTNSVIAFDKIPDTDLLVLSVSGSTVFVHAGEKEISSQPCADQRSALETCAEIFETMNMDGREIRRRGGSFPRITVKRQQP